MNRRKLNFFNPIFLLLFTAIFFSFKIGLTFRYSILERKLLHLVQEINQKELEISSMKFGLQNQISKYIDKTLYIQKVVPKVIFE